VTQETVMLGNTCRYADFHRVSDGSVAIMVKEGPLVILLA
jgi:hypothetical protein